MMGTLVRGLLKNRWQPQLQFVRNKTKVSVTRPRPPHFDRALLETVCRPFFLKKKKPHIPDYEACAVQFKKEPEELDHPLLTILANNCINIFNKSRMIALFQLNYIDSDEKFECELALKKIGMKFLFCSREVVEKALKGTMYEAILPLFLAPTAAAYGPEPDIKKLLDVLKKMPKVYLMAGIVDNRLLSVKELETYSKLNDITTARVMLLSTLNSVSQNLVQQINHHPSNFVGLLNQQKKILEGS